MHANATMATLTAIVGSLAIAAVARLRGVLSVLSICASVAGQCDPAEIFLPINPHYPAGDSTSAVAIGDLDGDGVPDLTTTNGLSDDISVLMGNGDGTFASHVTYAVGDGPQSVAIGDLDGDGAPDLAVANLWGDTVGVLMGNGDGTFGTHVVCAAYESPGSIAVSDLDGDGIPDLATANFYSNTASVLLGNGDGTFAAHVDYSVGNNPNSIAIGDLDRDGAPDLATANFYSSTVSVLLGNGDGTFAPPVTHAAGNSPSSVAIGDLDGDDILDLVVADWSSNNLCVLMGHADGTFAPYVSYAAGMEPISVAIDDLTGDGVPDLAVANWTNQNVSVLAGDGDGTFGIHVMYDTGDGPRSVAIADLDVNGTPDLAVANREVDNVSVLLNQCDFPAANYVQLITERIDDPEFPTHAFEVTIRVTIPEVSGVSAVSVTSTGGIGGALYGDGGDPEWHGHGRFVDFATMRTALGGLWIITIEGASPSTSTFTFNSAPLLDSDYFATPTDIFPANGAIEIPPDVVFSWTDPTGPETPDVLVVYVEFRDTGEYQEDESIFGTLDVTDTSWDPPLDLEPGINEFGVAYGNFDARGLVSELTVTSGSIAWGDAPFSPDGYPASTPMLAMASSTEVEFDVLLGGGVVFDPPIDIAAINEPAPVGSIDFDGVGGNDIALPVQALVPTDPGTLAVFLNDGTGTAYTRADTPIGVEPSGVAVGDFDGIDGPDAAVTNAGDDNVYVLLNDGAGAGTFLAPQVVTVGTLPSSIDAGDVDADGDLDLVVSNKDDDTVSVLINDGTGTYSIPGAPITVGDGPSSVRLAPMYGAPMPVDALDLFVANEFDSTVMVFQNDGAGGYTQQAMIDAPAAPVFIDPDDFDDDKQTDVGVVGRGDGIASVLLADGVGGYTRVDFPVGAMPTSLDAVDLDADFDTDMLVVAEIEGSTDRAVRVLRSELNDTGEFQFTLVDDLAPDPQMRFALSSLLDGDERPDVIAVSGEDTGGDGQLTVILNTTVTVPGDVNGDGTVEVQDLLAILAAWGECAPPPATCPADFDDDGFVGVSDLLVVLAGWTG